jgi:hypothetical protein
MKQGPQSARGKNFFTGPPKGKGWVMKEKTKEKTYRSASRDDLKNPDYSYIKRDLRRILLIASSFIAIMVVLSIVFR